MLFIAGVSWGAFKAALVQLDKLEVSIKSVQDLHTKDQEQFYQLRINWENTDGKIKDLKEKFDALQRRLEDKKIVNVLADNPLVAGEKHTESH